MVLAGPGAGKTFVITNRIGFLISEMKVPPEEILVVTFSRAAAVEMKERFDAMTRGSSHGVRFGTFHSVFFEILKRAYHYEAKDIATDKLVFRFVDEALRETGYDAGDRQEFLEDVIGEISRVKGDGINIEDYYSSSCPEEVFRSIYNGYQERLIRNHALDFDDMVIYSYELLSKRADILKSWQERFKYILVDEFQDINRMQYENIRMLARPLNNLFIVGDDDQSIYGFRGSRPDIMLSFPKQYPEARVIRLNINYRCSEEILSTAGRLISHNKKRYAKDISSNNGSEGPVHISYLNDIPSEAEKICEQIEKYIYTGISPEQIAVLFRTNMQMRMLSGKLMNRGIPFRMKESVPNIFRSFIAKDIIAYLQISRGDDSKQTFIQIMNKPLRYLSPSAIPGKEVSFRELRSYYMKKKQYWMLDRLSEMESDIKSLKKMSPVTAIHFIRRQIGYEEYLKNSALEKGIKPDDQLELLDEIEESAVGMATVSEWIEYTENYEEELKKIKLLENDAPGVGLMTMHGSKGLEFDVVFIPTLNEGVIPYRKAVLAPEIEEERRMLYVAMTRARHHLHLSYVGKRFNKKAEASRFIKELGSDR